MTSITVDDVLKAQHEWSSSLIHIGKLYDTARNQSFASRTFPDFCSIFKFTSEPAVPNSKKTTNADTEDYRCYASHVISDLYDFDHKVLFKPTKASVNQFRTTHEDALSYFVGGKYPEDDGFALQCWKKIDFQNHDWVFFSEKALVMGNYFFTNAQDEKTKVEYTFGYEKRNGKLKIFLHHSSLVYTPPSN